MFATTEPAKSRDWMDPNHKIESKLIIINLLGHCYTFLKLYIWWLQNIFGIRDSLDSFFLEFNTTLWKFSFISILRFKPLYLNNNPILRHNEFFGILINMFPVPVSVLVTNQVVIITCTVIEKSLNTGKLRNHFSILPEHKCHIPTFITL